MIIGKVTEAALQPLKEAGFEGVETTHICPEDEAAAGRAVAEKMGMRVHSVLRGWMEFNSEDPKKSGSLAGKYPQSVARGPGLMGRMTFCSCPAAWAAHHPCRSRGSLTSRSMRRAVT